MQQKACKRNKVKESHNKSETAKKWKWFRQQIQNARGLKLHLHKSSMFAFIPDSSSAPETTDSPRSRELKSKWVSTR